MFSVVIPTRARADTLRHTLRTVIAQPERDLEIVVHESGDDPATAVALAEFDDRRIRVFKTGDPVLMTENWERALQCTTGQYIIFIGDDDGLMPHACAIARAILSKHSTELISSNYALYLWPDYFDERIRHRMFARYTDDLSCTIKNSRTALQLTYQFRRPGSELPMIYHSFVARSLIDRVRKSRGVYFFGLGPDVTSGILNLYFTDEFIFSSYPLSVSGMSKYSNNARIAFSGNSELRTAAIDSSFGDIKFHRTLVPSYNTAICFANELLLIKEVLFPDAAPELDYAAMLRQALQSLNEKQDQYDLELAACRAIAERNYIALDEGDAAPEGPKPTLPPLGRHEIAPGVVAHTLDGQSAGVSNVFEATVVFNELLPPPEKNDVRLCCAPAQVLSIALNSANPTELDPSAEGNCALLLGIGWCAPESWGVWSNALRSELIIPATGYFRGLLKVVVRGQIFCPPRTLRVQIQQDSHALIARELYLTNEAVAFELFPIELQIDKPTDELRVVFTIDRCISPSELSLSGDTRRLGFGLTRIQIAVVRELADG